MESYVDRSPSEQRPSVGSTPKSLLKVRNTVGKFCLWLKPHHKSISNADFLFTVAVLRCFILSEIRSMNMFGYSTLGDGKWHRPDLYFDALVYFPLIHDTSNHSRYEKARLQPRDNFFPILLHSSRYERPARVHQLNLASRYVS